MNQINVKRVHKIELPIKTSNLRGAKVFGCPLSHELYSYIGDVVPESRQQRLVSMFFAGVQTPFSMEVSPDYSDEENTDEHSWN